MLNEIIRTGLIGALCLLACCASDLDLLKVTQIAELAHAGYDTAQIGIILGVKTSVEVAKDSAAGVLVLTCNERSGRSHQHWTLSTVQTIGKPIVRRREIQLVNAGFLFQTSEFEDCDGTISYHKLRWEIVGLDISQCVKAEQLQPYIKGIYEFESDAPDPDISYNLQLPGAPLLRAQFRRSSGCLHEILNPVW